MVPAIIDVEASGFGPGSYPIEIGIAMPNGSTHCYLIKPLPEWTHWDTAHQSVHQIPRDILLTHGRSVETVAMAVNELVKGQVIYSDRWGMITTWVSQLFYAARIPQMFVIESLHSLIDDHQADRWDNLHQHVQDEMELTRHRASSDALILQKTFVRTQDASPV